MSDEVKEATLMRSEDWRFRYHEKSIPASSNLDFLTYGTYEIAPLAATSPILHQNEEALLFCIDGKVEACVAGETRLMTHYDVLYVPLDTPYSMRNISDSNAKMVVCRAKAEKKHEVFHAAWETFSKDETRIRHLDGKDVFLMFDVSEKADRLIAGYTIYEPYTRAYPAHNHTDQEEIYIFIKGKGAMEVYKDEKSKTFVTSVNEMDAVTIPVLNYHPVFSQDEELHFIWCIAGERYWVGDKNKDFMKGDSDTLTT
ncbi:MAG: cupin domain-containing protein [Victivallales bacterium]|nr:cupin domain-containing protein [Victivallales bacterium]